MNIAVIIAGGVGQRMGSAIPKQFININNIPIIIYTIKAFEEHKLIDHIGIVCLKEWSHILKAYCSQYNLTKVKWIIDGGNCGQESIYNAVAYANDNYKGNDLLLIHDAVRPLVTSQIISDCIRVAKIKGNAVACQKCTTVVLSKDSCDSNFSNSVINRDQVMLTQTPQAFTVSDLYSAHTEAISKGIFDSVASCTLMIELDRKVHFSYGEATNIKLTDENDLKLFSALLAERNL